jgi:hypothetical protein
MSFDLAYIDTYSEITLSQFKNVVAEKKIILIDSNFTKEAPVWADLVIILEKGIVPEKICNTKYLSGLTLIKNKITKIKIERTKKYSYTPKSINAVVNFGGSIQAKSHLLNLKKTFMVNRDVKYIIYCAPELVSFLSIDFRFINNLELRAVDSSYYDELVTSDFLITAPGTSFMESIYIGIPIVLFNLFDSTKLNFSKFRYESNVLFSGEIEDISTDWNSQVLLSNTINNYNPVMKISENFIDTNDLELALGKLNF